MYQPGNAALLVVGDVKLDAIVPQLEMQFGSWKGASPARTPGTASSAGRPGTDHHRGHAGCRAVADSHRLGGRASLDARLLHDRGAEHDPRRLVHVASQPEPARGASIQLRRQLAFRHAAVGRCVPGRSRRPDRQDRRGVEGVLQRAEWHPQAGPRGGADQGQELRRRSASPASSRRAATSLPRWRRW